MTEPRALDVVDAVTGDDVRNFPPTLEVGRTGVRRNSGYVNEEFLPQLRGRKGIQIYREMADNSPTIGAFLLAIERLIRQVEWRTEAASNSREDRANSEFLEQAMGDMEHSFGDLVTEIMSMATYGWSFFEVVFKRRVGPWERNPRNRSKYTDGRLAWRKIAIRGQESMVRWVFADNGDIEAMVQMPAPRYEKIVLPMSKGLLFKVKPAKGNPESVSLLRNAYLPWWYCKRMQEIEAIGVERDLCGMPVAYVPPEVLQPAQGSAEAKLLAAMKQAVTSARRNEQDGMLWPLAYDRDKNLKYEFKLLTSGGSRQFNIRQIVDGYKTEMLMSVLADFMMVGHEDNGGSYALHTDKSGMFRASLNALAQSIADVFNRKAIPQLFAVNGMKPAELPRLVPNNIDPPALAELGAFLTATANVGMQWFPDAELEEFMRDAARLPKLDKEVARIHEVEERQAAILSLAQQQLQLLQVQQQAHAGEQSMAQQQMQTQSQALNLQQQAQAAQNPEQPDPQQQAQGQIATATGAVKLEQEKAKLANLKRKQPVGKRLSAFGVDHEGVA